MIEIRQTAIFADWLANLRNRRAAARIAARIDRLRLGDSGVVEPVGEGVSEMKIDCGPGYRVYFKRRGTQIVVLLCGGDKSTQDTDIRLARELAQGI